jgi:exoribonuclease-2
VVESCQGSKVRLWVGFDGRSQVLPQRQLDLISSLPSGTDPPRRLGSPPWSLSAEGLRIAKPDPRAWATAWLLLRDEPSALPLAAFTDLVCGNTRPVELAACWQQLVGTQLWFRWKHGQAQPRRLDELRQLRLERHRRILIERQDHSWLDLLRRRQRVDAAELPEGQRLRLELLKQLAGGTLEADQLDPALLQSLRSLHIGTDRGEIRHLLADLGQWDPHHLVSIAGTTWSTGFTPELLEEADRLLRHSSDPWPGDDERRDLTRQRCFTIDDDDTRDIDDALALERRSDGPPRLWIHVADPGRLIQADSPLDLEARRRGSSLYLASGILPMFPEPLSVGPLSLRAGQRCAAWSSWVELDADGAIAACGIVRSWVQPTYRLSYGDADELIDLAPPEEADLAELERLLHGRRRWRVSQGALLMDQPEGRIRCVDGQPQLQLTDPSPSRLMVAEAMILAGSVAARFAQEQGLALPFRSQLPAELPSPAELQALPEGAVRFAAIRRCLSRGLMGTRPAPHFSLGLPAYVQATSPIRRYGDLVVQRQIGACLAGQPVLSESELGELLEQFDGAVRQGIGIAREDQRHWQQVWFEAHRSGQWRARFLRWLRPQDRLGLVRIDSLAMDLAAECPQKASPGDDLLLRVLQVDSLRDQLRLVASAS